MKLKLTFRTVWNENNNRTVWEWLYERGGEFLRGGYCDTLTDARHNARIFKPCVEILNSK